MFLDLRRQKAKPLDDIARTIQVPAVRIILQRLT